MQLDFLQMKDEAFQPSQSADLLPGRNFQILPDSHFILFLDPVFQMKRPGIIHPPENPHFIFGIDLRCPVIFRQRIVPLSHMIEMPG